MKKILSLTFILVFLAGCKTSPVLTKGEAYPNMYKNKPLSILIVPAVNQSTAADAAQLYATTIAEPVAEAGYYVMPVPVTDAIFQSEGIVDGAQLETLSMEKIRDMFGADAILFVKINRWETNYYVTGGDVTVGASFRLISAHTDDEIWKYSDAVVINTSGNSGNLIADMISTAINTALTDYVPIARQVNFKVMNTLPAGKYNELADKDQLQKVVVLDKTNF
jgi:hypothetical protein